MIYRRIQVNNYRRDITKLLKIYCEENKYSSELTESFNYKFGLFIDFSSIANLPNEALPTAFSSMLKGIAVEFYHSSFHGTDLSITNLVQQFQSHFEGAENC